MCVYISVRLQAECTFLALLRLCSEYNVSVEMCVACTYVYFCEIIMMGVWIFLRVYGGCECVRKFVLTVCVSVIVF